MPSLHDRIRWLWPGGSAIRLEALRHTLAVASPNEADALAAELLAIAARGRRTARAAAARALIGHWPRLSPDARRALIALGPATLHGLLRSMLRDSDPEGQLAAATAAAEIADPALLPPLIDHVLASAARPDAALLDAVEAAVGSMIDAAVTPAERRAVGAALDPLIDRCDVHRRAGFLASALRLGIQAGPAAGGAARAHLRPWLLQAEHPSHLVLRGIIRKTEEPWARAAALTGLTFESLKAACLERLARPTTGPDEAGQSGVLSRWHLILHPDRRRRLARLGRYAKRPGQWLLDAPALSRLPAEARRGHVELASATGLAPRTRDAALAGALLDEDATVRLAAVRSAERSGAVACLHDFCFDADESVAESAALALLAVAERQSIDPRQRQRILADLARSPHARLRGLARALRDPEPLRAESLSFPGPHELVARAVAGGGVGESERFVLASAVTQLGRQRRPDAEPLLVRAATLPDVRVRANAIDALVHAARPRWSAGADRAGEDQVVEVLLEHALDPEHRIRANCARGLILAARGAAKIAPTDSALASVGEAGRASVAAMLADPRPLHRIAAMWLVERMAPELAASPEVVDRVHALTREHRPAVERQRALRCAHRLSVEIRRAWSRPASTLAHPLHQRPDDTPAFGPGTEAAA